MNSRMYNNHYAGRALNRPQDFHLVSSDMMTELALSAPTKKVNSAFDKWVKPNQIYDWRNTPRPKPPMPIPIDLPPTDQKIQLFQSTISWLHDKPELTESETKWIFWATKRIQDLKFPPVEVEL